MTKPEEILVEFRERLSAIPDKENQVRQIVEFAVIYGDCYGNRLLPILEEGIELSREIGFKVGEALCFCNLAFMNRVTGVESPTKFRSSLRELTRMVNDIKPYPDDYALGLNMLSYFHWFRGEYEVAFNLVFESLKLAEKRPLRGVAWNYFGLAVFYFDTRDFESSRLNYEKALELFHEMDFEYGKARASNGLGSVAIAQGRLDEATPLLAYAAGIYSQLGHYAGLSRARNDMGLLEKARGNLQDAVVHLEESIHLRREIDHVQALITSHTELGETYLLMGDQASALLQLQKGLELAVQISAQQKEMRLHKLLYDTYKATGNTEFSLRHFEYFFEIKTRLLGDEAANNIKKIQARFEREKSEKEAELERIKNLELKKANTIIEQKNKDITDSINYARRIQRGMLPANSLVERCFNDHFILFRPKDIVSGDFYWVVESSDPGSGHKLSLVAAVDCTGHGVPGAFMSMLGNTLLNQTIADPAIRSAADVLSFLNEKLPENLRSGPGEQHIRDGMDMSLCIFDFSGMKMQFAGANNPCWLVRAGEIIEMKGDKQAISAGTDLMKKGFNNHVVNLEKGDAVYLFTDGYADQFGGPFEKKIGYKRLRELLIANAHNAMEQQKETLLLAFEDWKGSLEQVDDVCVIGIRV